MNNSLTSLDELVWKLFEKITVAANKSLGWDKYDLVQIADDTTAVAGIGYGTYMVLCGLALNQYSPAQAGYLAMGAVCFSFSSAFIPLSRKMNKSYREKEVREILRTGVCKKPSFKPLRPFAILLAPALIGKSYHSTPYANEGVNTALDLALLTGGVMWESSIVSSYFNSQIMTPPSRKMSLWGTLWSYVTKPFSTVTPKPVEQPVSDYE